MAKPNLAPVTEADVTAVEDLLAELKQRAGKMSESKNVVMLSVYAQLVRVVSPEVQRLRARIDREDKAAINAQHKALRREIAASSNGA